MSSPFFYGEYYPRDLCIAAPAVIPISSFCRGSNKYLVTFIVNEKLC